MIRGKAGELALQEKNVCNREGSIKATEGLIEITNVPSSPNWAAEGHALGSGVCKVCLRQPGEVRGSRGLLFETAHWGCYIIHGQT